MIDMQEEFYTADEIAKRLRLSEETVKRLLRQKRIPGYKIGGVWRIDVKEFEVYLRSQKNIQDKI